MTVAVTRGVVSLNFGFVTQVCNAEAGPGFTWMVNHALDVVIPIQGLLRYLAPGPGKGRPRLFSRWYMETTAAEGATAAVDADGAVYLRAINGDEPAWQEMFDRWKKPLLVFFYRSLGSQVDAEELTLEVFVRLHRSADAYAPRAPFTAYLFRIARNVLLNELRRRKRKPAELLPADAFDYLEAPGSGAAARSAELEEVFQCALGQLPEHQRTLLLLVHQQQLAPAEAAAMLGLNPNALRVQLHRARQCLKELMAPTMS